MSNDKVKTLNQVVEEFYKDGEDEVANFKTRLETARDRLKELQKDAEMQLPQGISLVKIDDSICFNYSVQRDLRAAHVVRICEKFDPRVVRPASAVKRDGKFYLYDGQHTSVALAVFFEILNDTGILRAGTEEIHRGLLHRWHNDANADNDRNNPRVKTAYTVDTIFKKCSIDLEPKRVRKSPGKCGPNQHYFSHFDYAYKGLDMTGSAEVLENILEGVKRYYGDEDGGEINQGIYIGLVKMYALAKEDGATKFLPTDWIDRILSAMVKVCGRNAQGIHSAAKKQWQHTRGTSWDAPVAMSSLMREAYLLQAPEEDQFNPPHEPKVSMGVLSGDICSDFVPYWKQPNV
jgi:hypothetical protein